MNKRYDTGTIPEEEWIAQAWDIAHVFASPGGRFICKTVSVTPSIIKTINEFGVTDDEKEFMPVNLDKNNGTP